MASGARVSDSLQHVYENFKQNAPSGSWIILTIDPVKEGEIVVKTEGSSSAATAEERYKEFLALFSNNRCQYAVYKFDYGIGDGKQSTMIYVRWTPDNAKVQDKMLYTSSSEALKRELVGTRVFISGTEPSDLTYDEVLAMVARFGL